MNSTLMHLQAGLSLLGLFFGRINQSIVTAEEPAFRLQNDRISMIDNVPEAIGNALDALDRRHLNQLNGEVLQHSRRFDETFSPKAEQGNIEAQPISGRQPKATGRPSWLESYYRLCRPQRCPGAIYSTDYPRSHQSSRKGIELPAQSASAFAAQSSDSYYWHSGARAWRRLSYPDHEQHRGPTSPGRILLFHRPSPASAKIGG